MRYGVVISADGKMGLGTKPPMVLCGSLTSFSSVKLENR